jgi:hypothetical protein
LIAVGRRMPSGGCGKVHCLNTRPELLNLQKSGQFPNELVKIEDTQIQYVVSQVIVITVIKGD